MTPSQTELLQLLSTRSFKRGRFELASGAISDYYIDGRMTATHSNGAFLIGRAIYDEVKELQIDAIGGLEVGAVPLTTAAVIHYHLHDRAIEGFWVRNKVKGHGTRKLVEGAILKSGDRVVVVDDVFTTGGSALKAAEAVQELGCEVVLVLALVDRLQGAGKLFAERGIPYRAIFSIEDFGISVTDPGNVASA